MVYEVAYLNCRRFTKPDTGRRRAFPCGIKTTVPSRGGVQAGSYDTSVTDASSRVQGLVIPLPLARQPSKRWRTRLAHDPSARRSCHLQITKERRAEWARSSLRNARRQQRSQTVGTLVQLCPVNPTAIASLRAPHPPMQRANADYIRQED